MKITNCRATVSNTPKVFVLADPLPEAGRMTKLLQVRRPACSELTMLSRFEAFGHTDDTFERIGLFKFGIYLSLNAKIKKIIP